MLDVAYMAVHACQMTGMAEIQACYDMVTTNGAKTLNIQASYGLEVGKPANLILLESDQVFDCIRCRPAVLAVVSQGKVL